jgi:signal transduction histidine kinase
MNVHSIRWRLPLSYAAIALLAALALGSVMLLVLNRYYTGMERVYLIGNAQAIRPVVEEILRRDLPKKALQDQLTGFAFLSQTQIRVQDETGLPIADSGVPDAKQYVALSAAPGRIMFNVAVDGPPAGSSSESGPVVVFSQGVEANQPPLTVPPEKDILFGKVDTFIAVSASPFGYGFDAAPVASPERRSSQVAIISLADSPGTLELSNGPAYGSDILRSVAIAWAVAGVIAIALAALAGWYASRQVTQPVLAMTDATHRMEQGDLRVRVDLQEEHQQEFLSLASSFNSMAAQVEQTVSTLREFVADAAHELHTPLTALRANLELARDAENASARTLYLSRAQEQGQRLEALVKSLLDLSRVEAIKSTSGFELVNLTQLVREIGEQFASRAEQTDRSFTLNIPDDIVNVSGNETQLRQVVANLLENALKFTPVAGWVSLQLEHSDDEVVLSVSDSGIGIPPEDLPHIFERFHRARNVSEYPGNGLGLAIVHAIVKSQGGQVSVSSNGAGRGSEFILKLPKV